MDEYLSRRRLVKGRLTRLETVVVSHNNNPITPVASLMYKNKADSLAQDLEDVHNDIASTCTAEEFNTHEIEYNQLVTRMEALVIFFNTLNIQAPAVPSSIQPTADIKLPKLELPLFGGNYIDWFPFHDLFTATVHNNASLSGAQKFQYLKASLRDEAAVLVQSIPVTDGNYAEAWDILLNRFNNTREIINAHIRRLFNQSGVKDESATSLRRLIDTTAECIRALKVLQEPVQYWDALLLYLTGEKLDPESRRQWELSLKATSRPKYEDLTSFLEQKARALAASQPTSTSATKISSYSKRTAVSHYGSVRDSSCPFCTETHATFKCSLLLKASPEDRWRMVKQQSLCFNCLKPDHSSSECKSGTCRKCNAKHNTLLHRELQESRSSSQNSARDKVVSHVSRQANNVSQVILPTAIIQVIGITGECWPVRALIDSGSQASFISERFIQKLHLKRIHQNTVIGGIGATGLSHSRGTTILNIRSSIDSTFNMMVQVLILQHVTERLPNISFNPQPWTHLNGLQLADPTFNIPGDIDVLLGADVYLDVVQDGKRTVRPGIPGAFNTVFGWAVAGALGARRLTTHTSTIKVHSCQLDNELARFWELEEIGHRRILTSSETTCEEIFRDTISRDPKGRYVVKLPIKTNSEKLGESRAIALRRFEYIERRLRNKPELYDKYRSFINEYISLNHMELVPTNLVSTEDSYYLPHHSVLKQSSSTTKLRVVFDGSAKTSNGVSLNDILLVGPKLQDDLVNLLIRFRSHAVAVTADIEKMYRQILIKPEDTRYQRILWRQQKEDQIQDYRLLTVTYGTASAPYLATKVLQQLSKDVNSKYPLASQALCKDFYMDDLLSGADDTSSALELQKQLLQATSEAGLPLRKWASNDPALVQAVPSELREIPVPLNIDNAEAIQTLGLQWTPAADSLSFAVKSPRSRTIITKRTVLSDTARVFDPLGLLSPVTIRAKILLQEMWQVKIDWDQELSVDLIHKWQSFREDLTGIEGLRIERYISQPNCNGASLHGFCDASEKAFAAAVYLRTMNQDGRTEVKLIIAKTKVAPLKQTTLPRLELCAAVLLTRLISLVQESLRCTVPEVHGWSDSKIVLSWLGSPPQRWKTFVANRVAEIQNNQPTIQWHHVSGHNNPADSALRGIKTEELLNHPLWWSGPTFLMNETTPPSSLCIEEPKECSLEERMVPIVVAQCKIDQQLLFNYSSLTTLTHVTAYMHRFIYNTRSLKTLRQIGPLTKTENDKALNYWIKAVQQDSFGEEIHQLKTHKTLSSKSKLLSLTPFLDKEGVLRVGGRLRHTNLSADQIHPVIIPRKSRLTDLIISHEHIKTLHGGTQLIMASLQAKYWILGIRDAVRYHVRRCLRCVRQKAQTINQLMGDLPASRVNPGRAFNKCGVDYAGPFNLKVMKGRGLKSFKGYIAIFACFTTRALHLELVSDISTAAFLAAFKRFISRRGKCSDIYSDCGSNFIGANRELKEFMQSISSTTRSQALVGWMSDEGINWHFNPPAAPHFGGLWEAGVKSVKYHLKRVVGETRLNFEEMQTLLCQVEACLNSRPLSPMSADPTDLAVLTPGHFLIGTSLTAIPEPDFTSTKVNRLSRWQLGQQILQHFWRRWQSEYLSRLQQRPKWTKPSKNLQIGQLVLIKEELPPTKWKMARIVQIHPGTDNLVRVVTVKTADKELKRPVTKLCQLPLDE